MNTYPMTSTTFIRQEIEALEETGVEVQRYAVRRWSGTLVDIRDVAEAERTRYLLTENVRNLILATIKELFINPRGFCRGCILGVRLLLSHGQFVKLVAYVMQAVFFRQLARVKCVDHVHTHFSTNATVVAMLSRVMGGPSYSFTVHGPDEFDGLERNGFGLKISHASFVIAISDYCKNQLLGFTPDDQRGKLLIARCGLRIDEFEFKGNVVADNHTLVCVGRLCPQKGQILIAAAVAALRPEFPNLKVMLVGDGESRRDVEASIEKYDVRDMVQIRGWLPNPEVLAMVAASRALLLPSYSEGLPIVIMEALALGRPVISTTIAGIPELVDDTCGWLFPPGDSSALIASMRAALLCSESELVCKGKKGRERVERLHDRRQLAHFLHHNFKIALGSPTFPGKLGFDHR